MSIKAPSWAKNAHPTLQGWVKGKELLKAQPFTQSDIDEWYGATSAPSVPVETFVAAVEPKPTQIQLTEIAPTAPIIDESPQLILDDMSKKELEKYARDHGVELDRRQSKRSLLSKVKSLIS